MDLEAMNLENLKELSAKIDAEFQKKELQQCKSLEEFDRLKDLLTVEELKELAAKVSKTIESKELEREESKDRNFYLLTQNYNMAYDTYDSCVVVADSLERARHIHPRGTFIMPDDKSWAPIEKVEVEYLGKCENPDYQIGAVVCSSFNAG